MSNKVEWSPGVPVRLKVWEERWHTYHLDADYLPEGRDALAEVYGFSRDSLDSSN